MSLGTVDAVFFDAGGVLVLPSPEMVGPPLERAGVQASPEELDRCHYIGVAAWARHPAESDESWLAYHTAYVRELGVDDDRARAVARDLKDAYNASGWTRPNPGAPEVMAELARRGFVVAVVSNSDGTVEDTLRRLGVCQVGEGSGAPVRTVVDSGVVGAVKPDPRIFEIACERLGVAPERAVHVGDALSADVGGARAAGVRPVHLDPLGLCDGEDHDDVASLRELVELLA